MAAGCIGARVAPDGHAGVMLHLASESDFSAGNEAFGAMVESLCDHALRHRPASAAAMLDQSLDDGRATIRASLAQLAFQLREDVRLAELVHCEEPRGRVGAYVHFNQRVGALISIIADAPAESVQAFLQELGMHVAWSQPTALTRADVPAAALERVRWELLADGEPAGRMAELLAARLEQHHRSTVLLEQPWLKDPALTVQAALTAALGEAARIGGFRRLQVRA